MRTGCAGSGEIAGRIAQTTWGLARDLAVVACCFAVSLSLDAARAEEPEGAQEVPIGSFTLGPSTLRTPREIAPSHDGFSIVDPPAGMPERKRESTDDGGGRWFFQGWDMPRSRDPSPDDLYSEAKRALDEGRRDDAQRLFERLISDAPNSSHVAAARRYLGQIYRSIEAAAPGQPSGVPLGATNERDLPWQNAASDEARSAALDGISQPVSRAVIYQARVTPVVDSEFLSEAGDRVFFSAGSADLGARARGVIQAQARFLMRYPNLYAAVEGHADDGAIADAETLRISEERAAVVRDRLVAEGVDAERLVAYGRARGERVSDCPEPECLAQNRRAVTVLLSRRVEAAARPARRAQGGSQQTSPTQ